MAPTTSMRLIALIRQSLSSPSLSFLHAFFTNWLKLDLTTLAAALTIYGTLSGALKDLKGIAWKIYWYFIRFFTASISVPNYDRLNREILSWLSAQILDKQGARVLTASTESVRTDAYYQSEKVTRNDLNFEKRIPIVYLPTFGTTWFIHERHLFLVRRISSRSWYSPTSPDDYSDVPKGDEPLVVLVLGRSAAPIKQFFEACRNFADKQREAFVTVRAAKSQYGRDSWDTTILRPIRSLSTVHFDEAAKEELIADIENYLDPKTRKFYTERGIPYRRGYLLHGPPGTGKTSLSLALAGRFGLELYLCHLPSITQDSELDKLFSALPPRCIVLLEDIDAVGTKRKGHYDEIPEEEAAGDGSDSDDSDASSVSRSRVTLSGLLNVLDGVSSQEGRIVLMTSNMAHKLDKALVRPGRIDKMIFLGNISSRSAELMFLRMYAPDEQPISDGLVSEKHNVHSNEELQKFALEFSSCIPDNVFSPAQLQGFLLNKRGSAVEAAREIQRWVDVEKKTLDDAKKRAKDAAAWRAKKKKAKSLERALKDLAKVAKGDEMDEKDEKELEEELESLIKGEERKKKRKEGKVNGGDEKVEMSEEVDEQEGGQNESVDNGVEERAGSHEPSEQKEEQNAAPVDGKDEITESSSEISEKPRPVVSEASEV